jgi:RND family efflux transporter MFP subunit
MGIVMGCGQKEEPVKDIVRPVRAMKVADAAGVSGRAFPGRAKATEEVNLAFRVPGPLIERPVNVGDSVQKGDLIARIDPRDFDTALANSSNSLAQARAQLRAMRVARPEDIGRLKAALSAAKAEVAKAEADYSRVRQLYANDNASKADLDQARALRNVAREGVNGATENLRIGRRGARAEDIQAMQANIRSLQAQRKRTQDALEDTRLLAPFAGFIAQTFVENFQDVRAKQPVVRLLDVTSIEMVINIPENMISLAPHATDIVVRFDAFADRAIPAQIKEIGTEASETTRTYPVTLIMAQPADIKILPGMAGKATGRVDLPDRAVSRGLEVPVSAVFSDTDARQFVWIIDEAGKTVTRREVTVGDLTARGIAVTKGLQPGEWIATAGVNFLRDGQKVRLLPEDAKE